MNSFWSKTVFPIATIFAFRMLGLFLLIPVFSIYAKQYQGANPMLIGIALGIYGLAQGLLQIPFGLVSDKVGRKPVITLGLFLFMLGSLIAATTQSIYILILGRFLQGTGAIGSVLIALLADLTTVEQRTKAMAIIGLTIGSSFSLAMVLSPLISSTFGLPGIFYLTALLAVTGIFVLYFLIPNPPQFFHSDSETNLSLLKKVVSEPQLRRLDIGIFCQHFILTASFFSLPFILKQHIEQGNLHYQWHFYLPVMISSFLAMIPFIILAEKKGWLKSIFLGSILSIVCSEILLSFSYSLWLGICILIFIFFIAFNILEALLPSLISKKAHPTNKGTAMGIYSTYQFLGIFAGGTLAGFTYQYAGHSGVFLLNGLVGTVWFFCSMKMSLK